MRQKRLRAGYGRHAGLSERPLVSMGPTQAQNFHDIIHAYEDLADKFGLWDAAGIMKEYGCSDDGFIDFRAWLIAQGREVYFAALARARTALRMSFPTEIAALSS